MQPVATPFEQNWSYCIQQGRNGDMIVITMSSHGSSTGRSEAVNIIISSLVLENYGYENSCKRGSDVRSAYQSVWETIVIADSGPDGCKIYSIYQINMGWNNSHVFLHSWICLTTVSLWNHFSSNVLSKFFCPGKEQQLLQ